MVDSLLQEDRVMTRRYRRWRQRRQGWVNRGCKWLCARLGHFEDLLEPRCDLCGVWLAGYPEPRFDLSDLRYDPPELMAATVAVSRVEDRWVPGAIYS